MPTVTSETEICNLALTRLGHFEITALTENTKPGRLCNRHYVLCRDSTLRAHPWNFAIKRVDLAVSATTPPFEYTYQFPLPSDFLKVIRTEDESASYIDDYRIESTGDGLSLMSNSGTVAIEYIARVSDVSMFDALFVDVLAQRLAMELCMPMTDNATLYKNVSDIYQMKLREARSVDSQEGTPRDEIFDTWLNARI